MSKTLPSIVKNRPFKIWSRNSVYDVNFRNFEQYFPRDLAISNTVSFNIVSGRTQLRFRRVVVKSIKYGYVSSSSIEAFRKVIAPHFRKKKSKIYKFSIKCYPYLPLTKKPAEVRMGGGKGTKVRDFFSPVRPGQILFDVVIKNPGQTKKLFLYAARKLAVPVKVFCVLKMLTFINNNSKVWISDNSGVSRIRSIIIYNRRAGKVADLFVGSLSRVKPRRKLKKGQIFRALIVQGRKNLFRAFGSYIRSLSIRSILIRRAEFIPLTNRVNGFFFYEIKLIKEYKFNSLTVYIILCCILLFINITILRRWKITQFLVRIAV